MPYLNLDPNYPDHPKTVRLMSWLGEAADAYPIRLWAYCARVHPKDGKLNGYSVGELEAVIRWRGDPEKAVTALMAVGYLKKTENGFACVDWKQHQGHLEAFSRRGKENAKKRWSSYANSIPPALQKQQSGNAPAVPSIPALPDQPKQKQIRAQAPFVIPSVQDVSAYCLERKNAVDPQHWVDYWTARGWRFKAGQTMKDWKAAVRTWEKNNGFGAKQNFGPNRVVGAAAPTAGKYDGLEG